MGSPRLRVIVDHAVVSEVPVRGPVTLGRAPDNSVVLSDPSVSARHGRIEIEAGTWRYTDLGGLNGTRVAAGPHLHRQQSVPLSELTQLKLGGTIVEFDPGRALDASSSSIVSRTPVTPVTPAPITPAAVAPPGREPAACPARLIVVTARGTVTHDLLISPVVVGRDPACDVSIDAPSVSVRHAELGTSEGHWALRDLGSTNGTAVGLARVGPEWRPLVHGSHVVLGDVELAFVLTGPDGQEQHGGCLDPEASLSWLRRRHKLDRGQAREVLQACARGEGSVEELLVSSGALSPGELPGLRHDAALRSDNERSPAGRLAAWALGLGALVWAVYSLAQALAG